MLLTAFKVLLTDQLHNAILAHAVARKYVYYFYSSKEAYEIFKSSPSSLNNSENLDYMVGKFKVSSGGKPEIQEDLFEVEKFLIISEKIYDFLFKGLCRKIKILKIDPSREDYIKKIKRLEEKRKNQP